MVFANGLAGYKMISNDDTEGFARRKKRHYHKSIFAEQFNKLSGYRDICPAILNQDGTFFQGRLYQDMLCICYRHPQHFNQFGYFCIAVKTALFDILNNFQKIEFFMPQLSPDPASLFTTFRPDSQSSLQYIAIFVKYGQKCPVVTQTLLSSNAHKNCLQDFFEFHRA